MACCARCAASNGATVASVAPSTLVPSAVFPGAFDLALTTQIVEPVPTVRRPFPLLFVLIVIAIAYRAGQG
jgi:hypothetical protein